jgi:hypothetical protein
MPGFLKTRISHSAPLRVSGAMTVYLQHAVNQAHWVNFAELARDVRGVLGSRDVKDAIEANYGPKVVTMVGQWIALLEQRGASKAMEMAVDNEWISMATSGKAVSSLGFNMRTILMQTDSAIRFIFEMPLKEIAATFSDPSTILANVPKAWKSAAVQRRILGGTSPETRYIFEQNTSKPGILAALSAMSMLPMQYADAGMTSVSSAIVFSNEYRKAKEAGMNETLATKAAADAMERAVYKYSQPVGFGSKSLRENTGWAVQKMIMLFMSDPRLKTAIILEAVQGLTSGKGDKADHIRRIAAVQLMALVSHVLANFYRDAFTDDEDEDIWGIAGFGRALLLAPFQGLFVGGAIMDQAVSFVLGEKFFEPSRDPLIDAGNRAKRAFNNRDDIFNFDDPDALLKEWENIARTAAVFGTAAAMPATLLNLVKPAVGLKQNIENEE